MCLNVSLQLLTKANNPSPEVSMLGERWNCLMNPLHFSNKAYFMFWLEYALLCSTHIVSHGQRVAAIILYYLDNIQSLLSSVVELYDCVEVPVHAS